VGGGHKKRALAHGYSMNTPSGLRTSSDLAPRLQHKMWDTPSPTGEGKITTRGARDEVSLPSPRGEGGGQAPPGEGFLPRV
jgi:hypothetical protein